MRLTLRLDLVFALPLDIERGDLSCIGVPVGEELVARVGDAAPVLGAAAAVWGLRVGRVPARVLVRASLLLLPLLLLVLS